MKWMGVHTELPLSDCVCVGMCPFLVWTITSKFMNGFQKHFTHLFSLTSTNVMRKFVSPKAKVTVEGQIFILVLGITSPFMNEF